MKPTKPTKKQREKWAQTVARYRKRSREWVMEQLPTMSEAEWKEYTAWVAAFGNQTRGRRVKRQLKAARDANVTVTVTAEGCKITQDMSPAMQRLLIRASRRAQKGGPV